MITSTSWRFSGSFVHKPMMRPVWILNGSLLLSISLRCKSQVISLHRMKICELRRMPQQNILTDERISSFCLVNLSSPRECPRLAQMVIQLGIYGTCIWTPRLACGTRIYPCRVVTAICIVYRLALHRRCDSSNHLKNSAGSSVPQPW